MTDHDQSDDDDVAEFAEHAEHAEHADLAEHAEHAEHAEFAEFAEHAEFAEFAEHEAHDASAELREHLLHEHMESAEEHARHRIPGPFHTHRGADGQPDVVWRNQMLRLMDQAANRLQAAGRVSLRQQDRPEPRWPMSLSIIAAIVLQSLLPEELRPHPAILHYLILVIAGVLLLCLAVANPVRIERASRPIRAAGVAMVVLISGANAASAALLIKAIVNNQLPGGRHAPAELLGTGAAIWVTNVIAFALWYWEFDRGGPVSRLEGKAQFPDLMFPQMAVPELTPPGWGPRFVDYLYLSFTNATAFSPTDVMPLARWAKLTMLMQSSISLALGALVIARAVNILP